MFWTSKLFGSLSVSTEVLDNVLNAIGYLDMDRK